ncbi:TetR family transcriptional regulator [Streptomyces sp. NPDC048157]|uniref:TetR family transcriptional regulator n=1 Tax=Streptomyces sp. NPDC048157 TaxID=3365503 RepID=UPI0037230743
MSTAGFLRARSPEAKAAREAVILAAAARLATARGVREVTMTAIAEEVGMHKSAMLRYFETREDIFLRLAGTAWRDWSAEIRGRLGAVTPCTGADGQQWDRSARSIADALAGTLVARPLFCDLLAHTPLSLERNVSTDTVRTFKKGAIAEVAGIGDALCAITPLDAGQARAVVTTATSMAGALWQMAAPGTRLRAFYETDPELSHSVVDVEPRLSDVLSALLTGYAARTEARTEAGTEARTEARAEAHAEEGAG